MILGDDPNDLRPLLRGRLIDLYSFQNALLEGRFRSLTQTPENTPRELADAYARREVSGAVAREAERLAEVREVFTERPFTRALSSEVVLLSAKQAREMSAVLDLLIERFGGMVQIPDGPHRAGVSWRDGEL